MATLKLQVVGPVVLLWLRLLGGDCTQEDAPRVKLTTGEVEGFRYKTVLGRDVHGFLGLPYATPPLGRLRFKAPEPPLTWAGVRPAKAEPPACHQPWRKVEFPIHYSEDCLFLNVFTPYLQPPNGQLMPVMVWIHGGKFYQGSGSTYKYGPDFFMMKDVVVVNINYRLGVFGYLNMNVSEAQGNAALKDKVLALRWVQKEIHKFGGNPNAVTILGGSSGAAAVNLLYLSPSAKGLFHRAISFSGFLCEAHFLPSTTSFGLRLAEALGCPSLRPEAAVSCLKAVNSSVLAERQMMFKGEDGRDNPFIPSQEAGLGEEMFLPASPQRLTLNLVSTTVPLIFGLTSGEGLMFVDKPNENPDQFANISESLKRKLLLGKLKEVQPEISLKVFQKAKELYLKSNSRFAESTHGYLNFLADEKYVSCTIRTVKALSRRAPVNIFYFTFFGEFQNKNLNYQLFNLTGTVCHGEDLAYIFYRNYTIKEHNNISNHSAEMTVVNNLINIWTSFGQYGNTIPLAESNASLTWRTVEGNFTRHLVVGNAISIAEYPLLKERMDFWQYLNQQVNYL